MRASCVTESTRRANAYCPPSFDVEALHLAERQRCWIAPNQAGQRWAKEHRRNPSQYHAGLKTPDAVDGALLQRRALLSKDGQHL